MHIVIHQDRASCSYTYIMTQANQRKTISNFNTYIHVNLKASYTSTTKNRSPSCSVHKNWFRHAKYVLHHATTVIVPQASTQTCPNSKLSSKQLRIQTPYSSSYIHQHNSIPYSQTKTTIPYTLVYQLC